MYTQTMGEPMKRERSPRTPTERGGKALAEWLATNDRSQQWLAEHIRVGPEDKLHQMTISRWIGGVIPPANYAARIEEVTGVTVSLWGQPLDPAASDSFPTQTG